MFIRPPILNGSSVVEDILHLVSSGAVKSVVLFPSGGHGTRAFLGVMITVDFPAVHEITMLYDRPGVGPAQSDAADDVRRVVDACLNSNGRWRTLFVGGEVPHTASMGDSDACGAVLSTGPMLDLNADTLPALLGRLGLEAATNAHA